MILTSWQELEGRADVSPSYTIYHYTYRPYHYTYRPGAVHIYRYMCTAPGRVQYMCTAPGPQYKYIGTRLLEKLPSLCNVYKHEAQPSMGKYVLSLSAHAGS